MKMLRNLPMFIEEPNIGGFKHARLATSTLLNYHTMMIIKMFECIRFSNNNEIVLFASLESSLSKIRPQ